jgi:hypothetical protein
MHFPKSQYTPEEVFQIYIALPHGERTYQNCYEVCKEKGMKISYSLINKWGTKYEWQKRVGASSPNFKIDPQTIIRELKNEADAMTPELVKGLQHRLALKIATEIDELKLTDIGQVERAVKVLSDMDEIHHRHRGIQTQDKGDRANAGNKIGYLEMARNITGR